MRWTVQFGRSRLPSNFGDAVSKERSSSATASLNQIVRSFPRACLGSRIARRQAPWRDRRGDGACRILHSHPIAAGVPVARDPERNPRGAPADEPDPRTDHPKTTATGLGCPGPIVRLQRRSETSLIWMWSSLFLLRISLIIAKMFPVILRREILCNALITRDDSGAKISQKAQI